MYSVLLSAAAATRRCPGATTSGFAAASYQVGPRELYDATRSSRGDAVFIVSSAPTVIADGALPGDVAGSQGKPAAAAAKPAAKAGVTAKPVAQPAAKAKKAVAITVLPVNGTPPANGAGSDAVAKLTELAVARLKSQKAGRPATVKTLQSSLKSWAPDAFDAAMLARSCQGKTTSLKAALLDQRVVAGLGNIYVCEALHRSHLSPRRIAATLSTRKGEPTDHAKRLVGAIHAVLNDAIKAGGSSLRDHRQTTGELGYFQHSFRVYDREGEKCTTPRCGGIVKRFTQNGRSTFWCSKCQK